MATAFSWTPPRGAGLVVPKPNEMEQGRNDWGRRSVLEQFCSLWNIFGNKTSHSKGIFQWFPGGKGNRIINNFGAGDGNRTHRRTRLSD
jgi:hypothetical protein